MQFDKVLVALERFELNGADGASADLDADPIVADLSRGDPQGWVFEGVRSRRWEDVPYVYAPPTMESQNVNGVAEADLIEMVENAYSMWVAGTASDGTESFDFDLRRPLRVSNVKAENWFQLRIVGVTAIGDPGFGRASSIGIRASQSWRLESPGISGRFNCAVDGVLRRDG